MCLAAGSSGNRVKEVFRLTRVSVKRRSDNRGSTVLISYSTSLDSLTEEVKHWCKNRQILDLKQIFLRNKVRICGLD